MLRLQQSLAAFCSVLCISAGAQAESFVRLTGTLDQYLDYTTAPGKTLRRFDSSGLNAQRLTLNVKEELGGGDHLEIYAESGLDSATEQNGLFDRTRYIAILNDAWGEVALGKQYTPHFLILAFRLDAFGASFWGTPYAVFDGGNRYGRIDKTISYDSLELFGESFRVAVLHSLEQEARGAPQVRGTQTQYAVQWFPRKEAYLTAVHVRDKRYSAAHPQASTWLLGGAWDFGPVRISGAWQRSRYDDNQDGRNEMSVGARIPLSGGHRLLFSWSRSLLRSDRENRATAYGLGWVYDISRRTAFYASLARLDNGLRSARNFGLELEPGQSTNDLMMGVRHNF